MIRPCRCKDPTPTLPEDGEGEEGWPMANDLARDLRKTMTRQEVKLWVRLRELRELGFHFRRQSPIARYIVDFECRRRRLVIEVDGMQHGFDQNARCRSRSDTERTRPSDTSICQSGYRSKCGRRPGDNSVGASSGYNDPHPTSLRSATLPEDGRGIADK